MYVIEFSTLSEVNVIRGYSSVGYNPYCFALVRLVVLIIGFLGGMRQSQLTELRSTPQYVELRHISQHSVYTLDRTGASNCLRHGVMSSYWETTILASRSPGNKLFFYPVSLLGKQIVYVIKEKQQMIIADKTLNRNQTKKLNTRHINIDVKTEKCICSQLLQIIQEFLNVIRRTLQ